MISKNWLFILLFPFLYLPIYNSYAQAVIDSILFNEELDEAEVNTLMEAASIAKGQAFSNKKLKQVSEDMLNYFYNRGFLYVQLNSVKTKYFADSSKVNLYFSVLKGEQVFWGNVEIKSDSIPKEVYNRLVFFNRADLFSQTHLNDNINTMLALASDSGFIFAKVLIDSMQISNEDNFNRVDFTLYVKEGQPITIDEIEIDGNSYTRDFVILRELPLKPGERYTRRQSEQIPEILMRLGIFKDVKQPEVLEKDNGNFLLKIDIEEGNATSFDGVVGYIPESQNGQDDGFFTGLIDLTFYNLFGTARALDIHWEKPEQQSENFFLRYTEPWFLDYPVDLSAGLERTVRDTTYLEWKGRLDGRFRFSRNFSVSLAVERQVVLPDSLASINFRLARYAQNNVEIGLRYDTRDYLPNPRRGVFFENSYTIGLKENFGPGSLLRQDSIKTREQVDIIKAHFAWFYELFRNQVFALKFTGNQVKGDRLQLTDYFWFGGARTVRGYRENQFRGDITAWINLEYRFLTGRNSRIYLFNDWAAYRFPEQSSQREEILSGYGIGIRLQTGLGVMAVDFGLGEGDDFSQGKIHVGIINRF